MNIAGQKEKILIFAWLIIQLLLFYNIGINQSGEALRIIREAHHLIKGESFSSVVYYTYFTEILLVAISLILKIGFLPLVILQMTISLIALLTLFRTLCNLYNSENIALAACITIVICLPFQQFNTFIYTESLFSSFLIFFYCLIIKNEFQNSRNQIIFIFLAILICITRPSGCLIAFAGLTQLIMINRTINRKLKFTLIMATTAILFTLSNFLLTRNGGFNILKPFIENHIICDVPSDIDQTQFVEHSQLIDLPKYIYNNPTQFFQQVIKKSKAFFGLTRPWFSNAHNLFLIIFFYSLYLMIIAAIFKWRKKLEPAMYFNLLAILLFWLSVIFSCDEWSNRFLLTLTPLLITPAFLLFKKLN